MGMNFSPIFCRFSVEELVDEHHHPTCNHHSCSQKNRHLFPKKITFRHCQPPRPTESPLWLNNGKSCPGLVTSRKRSHENPRCEGRTYRRDGQNVSPCGWHPVIDMGGRNPLKTSHKFYQDLSPKSATSNVPTFTNLPL